MRYLIVVTAVICFVGCNHQTEQLRLEISQANSDRAELRRELQAIRQDLDVYYQDVIRRNESAVNEAKQTESSVQKSVQKIASEWVEFQKSYSAELREQLQQNVKLATSTVERLKQAQTSSTGTLASLKQLLKDAERLKDLCAKHAKETNDLNQVGQLTSATKRLEGSFRSFQSNLSKLQNDVRSANREAENAKRKAQTAERRARSAESKAQHAMSTAHMAMARAR